MTGESASPAATGHSLHDGRPGSAPDERPEAPAARTERAGQSPSPGRRPVQRQLIGLAKLALTLLATWLILRGAGVQFEQALQLSWTGIRLNAPLLALSVALGLPIIVFGAALWSRILAEFGDEKIGLLPASAILSVANLGRYLPGKVAQLVGVAILARRRGVSAMRAGAAAVTAQLLNLLAAALVGAWVLMRWPATQGWGGAGTLLIVATLTIFLGSGGAGRRVRWLLQRQGHHEKLPHTGGGRMLALLPGYVVTWGGYGLGLWVLARGLRLNPEYGTLTISFAAAYIVGYLAIFAPAGIGVRESILAALLTPHLGLEASVLLAAAQRIWITAVELLAAACGLFLIARRGSSSSSSEPEPVATAAVSECSPDPGASAAGGIS